VPVSDLVSVDGGNGDVDLEDMVWKLLVKSVRCRGHHLRVVAVAGGRCATVLLTQQLSELRLIILMCKISIPLMKKTSSKAILHQVFFQLIFRF
jgi:hypothetical protein